MTRYCFICNGSGKFVDKPCTRCKGSGVIIEEDWGGFIAFWLVVLGTILIYWWHKG